MIRVGILGATGYAGEELVYLLNRHPDVELVFVTSHNYADIPYSEIYKNYYNVIDKVCLDQENVEEKFEFTDIVFIALPHGKSFGIAKKAMEKNIKAIDLGADFRLKDVSCYENWYGVKHEAGEFLEKSVYGLPEINRERIKEGSLIANPGCYPTASILALMPALKAGIIEPESIIIDAKSGVSGAGRAASTGTLFCECSETVKAYGVCTHRHTPEIEQELSYFAGYNIKLSFTPNLIPMNRGILSVCYAGLKRNVEEKDVYGIYEKQYSGEPFIRVVPHLPETRWVKGSNYCDIAVRVDKRTNRLIAISAIDNLVKGAAGQAVQNMNLMFGLKETTGLEFPAVVP